MVIVISEKRVKITTKIDINPHLVTIEKLSRSVKIREKIPVKDPITLIVPIDIGKALRVDVLGSGMVQVLFKSVFLIYQP